MITECGYFFSIPQIFTCFNTSAYVGQEKRWETWCLHLGRSLWSAPWLAFFYFLQPFLVSLFFYICTYFPSLTPLHFILDFSVMLLYYVCKINPHQDFLFFYRMYIILITALRQRMMPSSFSSVNSLFIHMFSKLKWKYITGVTVGQWFPAMYFQLRPPQVKKINYPQFQVSFS